MPAFAANLSMMFTEWSFLDRFDAAADAGFQAVEYLFPYDHAPDAIAKRLERNRLTQALFNMPPGDWAAGERGLAALPDRFEEVRAGVETALVYAEATGCRRLHLMAGRADAGDPAALASYRRAVRHAGEALAGRGVELLLEPINGRDMPGYFLDDFGLAERLIGETGLPNVRLQFDLYHRQIIHGDVTMALRRLMPLVAHVQVASVPSRNEPDGEELNWPFLFDEIDRLGYQGFVGCEYRPRSSTLEGLGWFAPFRTAAG
ncbi:2-oxo-tetronate isomerase [Azospirillum picis]|uniref:Hydroxypyruvate isomerase n=1 Tax=Azospirillum picis TaxID=488438 RepID=A0ABU0MIE9_9PROT|nr:2-oxo-tetronate isomerase [Azospirillum picis]MBP2299170.1 hydroxypyruvate isomerase [Azospirillum picis]MDQ0533192.1 hydroxypyruvate isomerase [Azospirillum picis]